MTGKSHRETGKIAEEGLVQFTQEQGQLKQQAADEITRWTSDLKYSLYTCIFRIDEELKVIKSIQIRSNHRR